MKRYRTIMTAAVLALAAAAGQMTGCGTAPSSGETAAGEQTESAETVEEMIAQAGSGRAEITLNGDSASISGTGVSVFGGVVTITDRGTYSVTGSLEEGQIRVEAGDEDTVVLELNGAEVTNREDAAIHVENAGQTVILLGDGTVNRIQSGEETGISAGVETSKAAADFGYKGREFAMRNAFRDCRKLPQQFLRRALEVLARADFELKSSGNDEKIVLQKTITELFLLLGEERA